MKKTLVYIVFFGLIISTIVLGSVFSYKIKNEKIKEKRVIIYPLDKNFISKEEVMKLFKISDSTFNNIDIETLEKNLNKNKYIAKADVYKDLNSKLYAIIEQYKPIARVIGKTSYYIDVNGDNRPLSGIYTENVILVFGNLNRTEQKKVFKLLKQISKDPFLKETISEIHCNSSDNYLLRINDFHAKIIFGNIENADEKWIKLKAIIKYLKQRKLEKKYKEINLKYNKQVVCK